MEPRVGLDDPYGSLLIQDILLFYDSMVFGWLSVLNLKYAAAGSTKG